MRKLFYLTITLLFGAAIFYSCSASKKTTASTASITYTKDVKPIIDEHCGTKCHAAIDPAGGINLTNYTDVRHESVDGDLLGAIQHGEGYKPMPLKSPKLSDADIQTITSWVNSGAKE